MLFPHLESQIAHVDAEIARLKAHLIQLHRRRNALMPLSRLPLELVTTIFHHLIDDAATCKTEGLKSKDVPFFFWTVATQIYGHWRNAALGCPGLWTRMSTTNLAWFKAFVQRSGKHPLCIDTFPGKATNEEYTEMIRLVAANMHRIRTLTLRPNCFIQQHCWLQNVPAPQLEVLRCRFGRLNKFRLAPWTIWLILPPVLSTVTSLVLKRLYSSDELEIIKRCTSVRLLRIEDSITSAIHAWESTQPVSTPVIVPNLTYLRSQSSSLPMLASLVFPSVLKMDFALYFWSYDVSHLPARDFSLLAKISEPFTDPGRTTARLHHFSLSFDYHQYTVKGKDKAGEDLLVISVRYLPNNRLEDDPTSDSPILLGILNFVRTLNAPIHSIDVRGRGGGSLRDLFYLFRECTDVATLEFRNTDVEDVLIGFLSLPNAGDPPCAPEPEAPKSSPDISHDPLAELRFWLCVRMASFPGLQALVLQDFDEWKMIKYDEAKWLELFLQWLGRRRDTGMGLETLKITRCKFGQSVLDRLKSAVTNVIVE
ncbi:hypothetical protein AX16_004655 [Volvariella volvacea WC 439]|nr:hypothetical protein AX16_004655 [Volvariella volvacea WC 439]